jgi:hypothetical protein
VDLRALEAELTGFEQDAILADETNLNGRAKALDFILYLRLMYEAPLRSSVALEYRCQRQPRLSPGHFSQHISATTVVSTPNPRTPSRDKSKESPSIFGGAGIFTSHSPMAFLARYLQGRPL